MTLEERTKNSITRVFKAVFPNTTNHYDTLFGGTAMHLMDEVAFITATRFSRLRMVTVSSDRIDSFSMFIVLSSLLGIGTAIVYPTFLAAVSDYTHPDQRPRSIGVFRLWRDLGYAIGAILTGLIADQYGLIAPVLTIGLITIVSSLIVQLRMNCAKESSIADTIKLSAF